MSNAGARDWGRGGERNGVTVSLPDTPNSRRGGGKGVEDNPESETPATRRLGKFFVDPGADQ